MGVMRIGKFILNFPWVNYLLVGTIKVLALQGLNYNLSFIDMIIKEDVSIWDDGTHQFYTKYRMGDNSTLLWETPQERADRLASQRKLAADLWNTRQRIWKLQEQVRDIEYKQYQRKIKSDFRKWRLEYLDKCYKARIEAHSRWKKILADYYAQRPLRGKGRSARRRQSADIRMFIGTSYREIYDGLKPPSKYLRPVSFPKLPVIPKTVRLKKNKKLVVPLNFCNEYLTDEDRGEPGVYSETTHITASHYKFDPENPRAINGYVNVFPEWVETDQAQQPRRWTYDVPLVGMDRPFPVNKDIALLAALGNKIRRHEFNATNFFVESDETWAMFFYTVKQFSMAFRHLLRRDIEGAFQTLFTRGRGFDFETIVTAIANGYLLNYYGWAPLLSDVQEAAKALASRQLEERPPVRIRVSKSDFEKIEKDYPDLRPYKVVTESKVTQRYIVELEKRDPIAFGWDKWLVLDDPIQGYWEMNPLTFLWDWFLPIQQTLEAEYTLREYPIVRAMKSIRHHSKSALYFTDLGTDYYNTEPFDPNEVKWRVDKESVNVGVRETKSFHRIPLSELSVPRPTLKSPVSEKHILAYISLIVSALTPGTIRGIINSIKHV